MYMSDYDIALCDKLYDFRENFEEDNIYSYWILLTLINEVFLNQNQEVSIQVKENLKNTINILLNFYELKQERTIVDWNQEINLNEKQEILTIINNIYDILMEDEEYQQIITNKEIKNFFNNIIQKIDSTISQQEIDLPFDTQSEWEEEMEHILNNEPGIVNDYPEQESYYEIQKNPHFLKEYIFRTGLLPYKCANCGLEEWQNEPISLILDYKDGNSRNQRIENLQFLCPNCYSQIGKDFE